MRAKVDASPTAVARTLMRPTPLTAPPVTASPTPFGTGMLSPLTRDSSTSLAPSTTSPSTGTRPPGRTSTKSPSRTRSAGTTVSVPSSANTQAVSGRSARSACNAAAALRLARLSKCLPSKTRVMMTADASK